MLGCWLGRDHITFGGYVYPLDLPGEVIYDTSDPRGQQLVCRPTGTATSDDKAVVTANSTGNGKGSGKDRGKSKETGKCRGKDKAAAKSSRKRKATGNGTASCNPVVTEVPAVGDKDSVVTEVGASDKSVVTEVPEFGVEIDIRARRRHFELLTHKRDLCAANLENSRIHVETLRTMHKETRIQLAEAISALDTNIKAWEEANFLRNMAVDEALASNDPDKFMGLWRVEDSKRRRINGKQPPVLPRPPEF